MLVVALGVFGCSNSSEDAVPLPPLLKDATAGVGWASACPPVNETERRRVESAGKLAVSPEVDQRLRDAFPPGTKHEQVVAALAQQGFTLVSPCEADATIQRASFFATETGFHMYNVFATVYWKLDAQQRVVWTKGFISYNGP